jgi:CrcB protein
MLHWLLVFGLGGLGAVLRVGIGTAVGTRAFPWATLLVNLLGCLAIGALYEWLAARHGLAVLWRPALLGGLLGGFTTFSAFGLETWAMLQSGRTAAAVLYALTSVGLGVLGVAAGVAIVRPAG